MAVGHALAHFTRFTWPRVTIGAHHGLRKQDGRFRHPRAFRSGKQVRVRGLFVLEGVIQHPMHNGLTRL